MRKIVISALAGTLLYILMRFLEKRIKGAYKYFRPIG
jgi:hypothetical protein